MTQHGHPEFVRGFQAGQAAADTGKERRSTASRNVRRRRIIASPPAQALQPSFFVPAPPAPYNFDWNSVYGELKEQLRRHERAGDTYAVRALTESIEAVGTKIRSEFRFHHPSSCESGQIETETAYSELRQLTKSVGPGHAARPLAIAKMVPGINKLTHTQSSDFALRVREFAALRRESDRVRNPHALYLWLLNEVRLAQASWWQEGERGNREQADASLIEFRYFELLCREHDKGRDPWIVSLAFGRAKAKAPLAIAVKDRLEAAHRRLVRAMVDSASETADEPTSGSAHALVAPSHPTDQTEAATEDPGNQTEAATTGPANQTEAATTGPASRRSSRSQAPLPLIRSTRLPVGWNWQTAYRDLKAHYRQQPGREVTSAADSQLAPIDAKVMEAYHFHVPTSFTSGVIGPEAAYFALRELHGEPASQPSDWSSSRRLALAKVLTNIDKATFLLHLQLTRRPEGDCPQ